MKLNLSRSEVIALMQLFDDKVVLAKPTNTVDRLVMLLLDQIYARLWAKGPNPPAVSSLKLTDAEAIAFWCFWTAQELPITAVFEQNMLRQINTLIHQTLQL